MKEIHNRVAVITAGASGIGYAMAERIGRLEAAHQDHDTLSVVQRRLEDL